MAKAVINQVATGGLASHWLTLPTEMCFFLNHGGLSSLRRPRPPCRYRMVSADSKVDKLTTMFSTFRTKLSIYISLSRQPAT